MRIYFSAEKEVIVIEGTKQNFPAKSLRLTYEADKISVWNADGISRVIWTDYINIQNNNGTGFSSLQETVSYLNEEFSKSGSSNFDGGFF